MGLVGVRKRRAGTVVETRERRKVRMGVAQGLLTCMIDCKDAVAARKLRG
jgi:hypothetical protein